MTTNAWVVSRPHLGDHQRASVPLEQTLAERLFEQLCQERLSVSERHGIELDVCPRCRGVWLDRGELDKLLERDAASTRAGAITGRIATTMTTTTAPAGAGRCGGSCSTDARVTPG
jgi:hypothetical protein